MYQNTHCVVISVTAKRLLPPPSWPCHAGSRKRGAAKCRKAHHSACTGSCTGTMCSTAEVGTQAGPPALMPCSPQPCRHTTHVKFVFSFPLLCIWDSASAQGLCPSEHLCPRWFGRDVKGEFCSNPWCGQRRCLPLHPHPCRLPRGNLLFMARERVS